MNAFWWFRDNQLAGMARPGFNRCSWFDLPLQQAILLSWIGQQGAATTPLADFAEFASGMAPKVAAMLGLDAEKLRAELAQFEPVAGMDAGLATLAERTQILGSWSWSGAETAPTLTLQLSRSRIDYEIAQLRQREVEIVIALAEQPFARSVVAEHLEYHHFQVPDLGPPQLHHVRQVAEILQRAEAANRRVAVHCFAGIGRTGTMIIAAHLLRGQPLDRLVADMHARNPHFVFAGAQAEFLHTLAADKPSA